MSLLKNLEFTKKLPEVPKSGKPNKSPLELAKIRLTKEINVQISLAKNPNFKVVTSRKSRDTGRAIKSHRVPRSWVSSDGKIVYITPRFSNKVLNVGGKRGINIKTTKKKVVETLNVLKNWVESSESDSVLTKAMANAKRGRRKKAG